MGTIAAQLGLHRETVRAAVEHETGGVHRGVCRPSALDPYLPLIRNTLAQYPRLRATRIHEMVRQRGYVGSVIQVRRLVRRLRPESTRAVYRRVVTLVAEQAQVDWGSFGKILDLVRVHLEKEPIEDPGERAAFARAVVSTSFVEHWQRGVPRDARTQLGKRKLRERARLLDRALGQRDA